MTQPRPSADIARGVLLGTFLGDAIGARWEGAPAVDVPEAQRRLDQSLAATTLTYTDDTQLTFALAEHLCDHPRVEPSALVEAFLDHFEPHRGYARGMFGLVDAWRAGMSPGDAATSVFPDGSFGNGAAMRAAPVGVIWRKDSRATTAAARQQAATTHAHPIGMDAAAAQAAAVATAAAAGQFTAADLEVTRNSAATQELRHTLDIAHRTAEQWTAGIRRPLPDLAEEIGTGVLADQSVPTALWVAAVADDIPQALVLSLGLGGDVDTIAAMACAVVGAAQFLESVPDSWIDLLEDGRRGRSHAFELADRLGVAADATNQ